MPNASGKTSLGLKAEGTQNFFSDEYASGFTPFMEDFLNAQTSDASQFSELALNNSGCLLYTSPSPRDRG